METCCMNINVTSGEAKIFIDGVLIETQPFTVGSNGHLYTLLLCESIGSSFDGLIDEVSFSDTVLSPRFYP